LGGPVADDEDDLVAPLGERAELAQSNGVADVKIRVRRIEPLLDTEPTLTGREQPPEILANDDLRHPARQELVELSLAGFGGHAVSLGLSHSALDNSRSCVPPRAVPGPQAEEEEG